MQVSDLGDRFAIVYYRPDKQGQGNVRLVDGGIVVRAPYTFLDQSGAESPLMQIRLEATEQQKQQLKQLLVAMFQATNTAIETLHGWQRWAEAEE